MIIKEGMIGLSGGNEFIQKAIRFFTKSKFSHSFVVINGPYGVLSVLETTSTIMCPTPFHNKDNESNWIEMWKVNYPDREKLENVLRDYYVNYSGVWYAYLAMIWFMYYWLCTSLKLKKPTKMWKWASKGVGCTEGNTAGYVSKLFPELFNDTDLNTISPEILREIMLANPDKFECLGRYK